MRIVLIVVRLFLLATAAVALVAAVSVVGSHAGRMLLSDEQNTWSGLLGLLVAGAAGMAAAGAVSPTWILAHPAGAMFALVPLVVLLLIRFYSSFEYALTLNLALLGAVSALVALLLQPPAALAARKEAERHSARTPERGRVF